MKVFVYKNSFSNELKFFTVSVGDVYRCYEKSNRKGGGYHEGSTTYLFHGEFFLTA